MPTHLLNTDHELTKAFAFGLQTTTPLPPQDLNAAGVRVQDQIQTVYNFAPDDPVINETLDELEFYLLGEAPAPSPRSLSEPVKRFFAATLDTLVDHGELRVETAWHYIGTLGLEEAMRANALERTH